MSGKCCENCKHVEVRGDSKPCTDCIRDNKVPMWEPKSMTYEQPAPVAQPEEVIVGCHSCEHGPYAKKSAPCDACFLPNGLKWERKAYSPALDDLKKTIVLTPKYEIKAKELADEHWSYVKEVLDMHVSNAGVIGEIGFHYKTAFVHGYKHGKEDS